MNAYTPHPPLLSDAEFQAAQRYLDRVGMDDPTRDAELPDPEEPEWGSDAVALSFPSFPPLTCQCGAMSVSGITWEAMLRDWAFMDVRDHHLGRPCLSGLVTL